MTNPRDYLTDLMESVDVDMTKALDEHWGQPPHHEPPNESGPIYWEPAPAPGPASDPGPIIWEDPEYPGDTGSDPDHGPNPDEGYDPDAPAPDEPQPDLYPEDKNCWEVPAPDDSPPSEPVPDEIDCTTGADDVTVV